MANEKIDNVTNLAKKIDLVKPVTFRRRKYEIGEGADKTIGEYIECTAELKGESVRFKVDQKDSKLVKVLLRMYGYPLYDRYSV